MVGDARKGATPPEWSWEDVADRLRKAVEAELSRRPEPEQATLGRILETLLLELRKAERLQGPSPPQRGDIGRRAEARRRNTGPF